MATTDITLGPLIDLLRDRGVAAEVEMTGGNVATIYAAADETALIQSAQLDDIPIVTVGPGTFDWQDPGRSEASLYELSASQHPNGYDSEGETVFFDPSWSLDAVADEVVRLVHSQ